MNKYIEVAGKTEEEAIKIALEQLGLQREDISVEVLEKAKSGFFGLGGSNAKLRVHYHQEETKAEKTDAFLRGLFEKMGANAEPKITEEEDGTINVILVGENPGALIGRRGETLDAIQHLANYSVNRGAASQRVRINVDAENYRARRNDALVRLAEKVAGKVTRYRRDITLEPMNSYERHVIHTALQDKENISTYSVGNEPNRRVVVAYDRGGERVSRKSSNSNEPEQNPKYREWC